MGQARGRVQVQNTVQKNLQTAVVVLMMCLDENQLEIDHINIL